MPSTTTAADAAAPSLTWEAMGRIIDRAPSLEALAAHGVVPLALHRWRETGKPISPALASAERAAAFATLSVRGLLAKARDAYDGPMMLFKGPVVASHYPGGARTFGDIDLIVEDAEVAHRNLVAAGFEPVDEPELFEDIHHLQPLRWPGIPLDVEVHSRPKWPDGLRGPTAAELHEAGVDGQAGVPGVLVPDRLHHAMLVTAHGWAHSPLRSLRDLFDVAVMADGLDRRELDELARRWDLERVWRTTARALDHLLHGDGGGPLPLPLRLWAGHLVEVREQSVREAHFARWLGPFWEQPPAIAAGSSWRHLRWDLRPVNGEPWRDKLSRVRQSAARGNVAKSEHERRLGEMATRGDLRRIIRERRSAGGA